MNDPKIRCQHKGHEHLTLDELNQHIVVVSTLVTDLLIKYGNEKMPLNYCIDDLNSIFLNTGINVIAIMIEGLSGKDITKAFNLFMSIINLTISKCCLNGVVTGNMDILKVDKNKAH